MKEKDRQRLLTKNLADAYAYYQVLTDGNGEVVDFKILEVNRAFETMTGLQREQVLGKGIVEVCPGIERSFADWSDAYDRVAAGNENVCFEHCCEPAGRRFRLAVYADAPGYFSTIFHEITESRYSGKGGIVGVLMPFLNVTEQYLSHKELRKAIGYFEYLLKATRTGVDIVDKEYNLLYVDEFWQNFYGDPGERKCYEYFKQSREPCAACGVAHALETNEVTLFEQTLQGGRYVFECHAVPFQNEQGERFVTGLKTDITGRKELEEKLKFQLQFEKMVSGISGSLVDIAAEQIDGVIRRSLQQFGEFFKVDRGVIFQLIHAEEALVSTHEWCAPGIKPLSGPFKRFTIRELPWLFTQVRERDLLYAFDVAKLPPEAERDKEAFARQGIKSFLVLPFTRSAAGQVNGFLAFDSVREKKSWTGEQINLLRVVSRVITGAFTRQQLEKERNEALRLLRESEESLSTTLHSIGDGVIATDIDGKITRMNPKAESLTGWSLKRAQGRPLEEVCRMINVKTGEPVYSSVNRVLETGQEVMLTNNAALVGPNGTIHQISDSAAPIWDSEGKLCGVVMVFFDVTEQYRAREELQQSEARYRTIVENINEALLIFDFQLVIKDLNENAHRLLGYERKELIGANMALITSREDQEHGAELLEKLLRESRLLFEGAMVRRNGTMVPVEVSLKVVSRAGGGLVQGFIRDITKRKEDEQRIAEYTAELEELYQKLDQEMDRARQVHKRTLPKNLPVVKGVSLAAHYQPAAELGGDFYDVVKLGRKLIIYLSDVTGHGADGALLSLFVKHTIKGFLSFSPEKSIRPENILRYLSTQFQQKNLSEDYFICIFLAVLDLETMTLTYTAAGFQDAPLVRLGTGERLKLVSKGLFLSPAFSDDLLNLEESRIELPLGSTIFFNTDGLSEQQGAGGACFGERLPELFYEHSALPPRQIVQFICEDFQEFNGGSLQGSDDITFLVMQIDTGTTRVEHLELPSAIAELEHLRKRASAFLGNAQEKDFFLTCLHELVSNAMEHGHGLNREKTVSVELCRADSFYRGTVKDRGEGFDWREQLGKPLEFAGASVRGRGIALVRKCSDRLLYNMKGNEVSFFIYR